MRVPKIWGHRISRQEGIYENTLKGAERILPYAEGLETDAVASKDGKIFFIHDSMFMGSSVLYEINTRLDEASKIIINNRRIDEMNAEEIRTLRLIDGQKIPDFDDLANIIKKAETNFIINIELKSPHTFLPVARHIQEYHQKNILREDQFFLSSFNHPELIKGKKEFPNIKTGLLVEPSNTQKTPLYPWTGNENSFYVPYNDNYLDEPSIKELNTDYVGLCEFDLRPEVIAKVKENYKHSKIYIWWYYPERPPKENKQLFNTLEQLAINNQLNDLHAIITDFPEAMDKEIKQFWAEKKWG